MSDQFQSVLGDRTGYVSAHHVATGTESYAKGGRAYLYVQNSAESAAVSISAEDARRMGEALIAIAEANGA